MSSSDARADVLPPGPSLRGGQPPAQPPAAKIETKDLSLFYYRTQALKNVSLAIYPCEITALIGPSGCGKSALFRCLNRMNELIEGARVTGGRTIPYAAYWDCSRLPAPGAGHWEPGAGSREPGAGA